MFHGLPLFLPFSWPLGFAASLAKNASPCVAERLGAITGATIGVTTGATKLLGTALDFQAVKCQV